MGNWVVSRVIVNHGKGEIVISSTLNTFMARPQETICLLVIKDPFIAFKVAPPSLNKPHSRRICSLFSKGEQSVVLSGIVPTILAGSQKFSVVGLESKIGANCMKSPLSVRIVWVCFMDGHWVWVVGWATIAASRQVGPSARLKGDTIREDKGVAESEPCCQHCQKSQQENCLISHFFN